MKPVYLFIFLLFTSLNATDDKLQKLIQDFETYAQAQQKIWSIPGMAIAIIKDNEVLLAKGYGQRGLTDTKPVNEKTVFQLGSLTKAFTSTLIAHAIDQGSFKWNDKVYSHLPNFRLTDPWATAEFEIIDLLAQRSGLPSHAGDTPAFFGFSTQEMINNLQFLKPTSSFRSQYAYQNIFFTVAAHLLTTKTHLSYEEMLKKTLFTPLKMDRSTASLQNYLKEENRAQWLMQLNDGSITILKDDFEGNDWNYILDGAGAINSTAEDMAKWLIFQVNKGKYQDQQLISSENMELMIRPIIYANHINDVNMFYALGWVHMEASPYPIIWHDGATLGVYNTAAFIPQEKIGIVVLSNVRGPSLAFALVLQFFDMYYGKPNQDWGKKMLVKDKEQAKEAEKAPQLIPPFLPLKDYAGTYQNPVYGETIVKEENGELTLVIGKNQQHYKMKPWDGNVFLSPWICGDDDRAKINFIQGDEGVITKMEIDVLINEGNGTFEKMPK